MQLRALLPALVGLAAGSTIEDGDTFNLMALRSASAIHFANFNAALSSVFLRLPEQNATCDSESDGSATFYLKDGGLYLYDDNSANPQQLFVDRSGMGKWTKTSKRDLRDMKLILFQQARASLATPPVPSPLPVTASARRLSSTSTTTSLSTALASLPAPAASVVPSAFGLVLASRIPVATRAASACLSALSRMTTQTAAYTLNKGLCRAAPRDLTQDAWIISPVYKCSKYLIDHMKK